MFRKFEKITIRWIKLSTFRATDPWSLISGVAKTSVAITFCAMFVIIWSIINTYGLCPRETVCFVHPRLSRNDKPKRATYQNTLNILFLKLLTLN